MDIVVLGILIPTLYSSEIFNTDPLILVVVCGMGFFFFLMPHFLLKVLQKPKWTEIDSINRSIRLMETNKQVKTIPWDSLQFLTYSEYTYTVKTKNGSKTITVYTVLGQWNGETIPLAESTIFPELRLIGERIAKFLKVSIKNESGVLIPYTELDLPIHKRKIPKEVWESEITFSPSSQISIEKIGQDNLLKSNYNPKLYTLVAASVSFAFTLMIHFFIGSAFDLSVTSWETFPPNTYQVTFFILSFGFGFLPLAYVWWNKKRKKEIKISNDVMYWNGKLYPFANWEEILLKQNTLYLVNDHSTETYSLHFFCEPSDSIQVLNWIQKEIGKLSGGNEEFGRF
ncbi:hypothetical protein LEP1GSC195_1240 [Leptospira wolbachii serovar Codice str. CDC]|uniref:Uncharacterized protein n=2 Tax=Leptospira TaxID=171 RepID=R9AD53_9LEPT|nr:hypothetical protein LEP1GSC195_1240 [Leptospira wolbachii serovar Codice str. CDC]